ncbi:MAG: iron-sulfur cluster assembly accessory protein [Gammaproteobacteria bacterium]|nr:iron-sulfur cluster assembly accessory protein [Gammaproteobacteria bacterium]
MINITPKAAEQVRESAEKSGAAELALRVAARADDDGRLDYALGFDQAAEGDLVVEALGVTILVAEAYKDLLIGATIDYVELNPGEFQFIVQNPNDPNHRPSDFSGSST